MNEQLKNEFDALFGRRFTDLVGNNMYVELRNKIINWKINSIPIEPPVMQKIAEVIDAEIKTLTRKPTHGPCCTCQECGQHYDDCNCTEIKTLKNIKEKLASNFSV